MDPRALQKLKKCTDNPFTDYQYTFFNAFHNYVQTEEIYAYIRGLNSRGLRNLWNHIVAKWLNMKKNLKDNITFKRSIYSKMNCEYNHQLLKEEEFEELVNHFMEKNKLKCIFVVNCIYDYTR